MKDLTGGNLDKALNYANIINDVSLLECLNCLKTMEENYGGRGKIETEITTGFAPLSFYFDRYDKDKKFCGNGGIIFHGKHDNRGDGGAPTFSVCIEPCNGWQIHT